MKVVQINSSYSVGAVGKICVSISKLLTEKGIENYILYSSGKKDCPQGIRYMTDLEIKIQTVKSKLTGYYGLQSKVATRRLLTMLDQISPDIVHLHNLHSHNVHLGMLFSYLKEKKIKVFWTFHDCWAFTGYCPYYDLVGCEKWKTPGCNHCPSKNRYSWSFDRSEFLYKKKKEYFSGLDLTIITPSQWLADQVKLSFLKNYPIKVIHNGIDLSLYSPQETEFRKKYQLENKFILLGVAMKWVPRKGLDVLIRLAERLDPEKFQIVLVGTNKKVDQQLPDNIISIHRTESQTALAEIYSAADLFVNPTREENFPTVNIESLACGTPIVTFRTGGSPEIINEETGLTVDCNDEEGLYQAILKVAEERPFLQENCIARAQQFAEKDRYMEYYSLYMETIEE